MFEHQTYSNNRSVLSYSEFKETVNLLSFLLNIYFGIEMGTKRQRYTNTYTLNIPGDTLRSSAYSWDAFVFPFGSRQPSPMCISSPWWTGLQWGHRLFSRCFRNFFERIQAAMSLTLWVQTNKDFQIMWRLIFFFLNSLYLWVSGSG